MNATILNPPDRPRGISNSRSVSRNSLLSTRRRSLSRLINRPNYSTSEEEQNFHKFQQILIIQILILIQIQMIIE